MRFNYLLMQTEISIEREIQFMLKYSLTPEEYFLMRLIFLSQNDHDEYLSLFYSQGEYDKPVRELLISLQDKGIIVKDYKIPSQGQPFEAKDVILNKNFIKSYLQHSQALGMELFEHYPLFTTINGRQFSLRNIAKSFKTFDDFCYEYGKAIKFNPQKHQEILDLLDYAKENNLIQSGICDFVISRQWLTIEALKDGGYGTFETVEFI